MTERDHSDLKKASEQLLRALQESEPGSGKKVRLELSLGKWDWEILLDILGDQIQLTKDSNDPGLEGYSEQVQKIHDKIYNALHNGKKKKAPTAPSTSRSGG